MNYAGAGGSSPDTEASCGPDRQDVAQAAYPLIVTQVAPCLEQVAALRELGDDPGGASAAVVAQPGSQTRCLESRTGPGPTHLGDMVYLMGRLRLATRSQRTLQALASSQKRRTTAHRSALSSKCSLRGMTACQ